MWDTATRKILYKLPGHLGSVNEGLASLNEVLGELGGKQVVIHQQKRGWFGGRKSNGSNGNG